MSMDSDEYEERQESLRQRARDTGSTYYDPDSRTVWKRFILGPVPWWRRLWWAYRKPGFTYMMRFMDMRMNAKWDKNTAFLRPKKRGRR